MHKVGINFDEISDDLDVAVQTMKDCDVAYGELRTINQKNFVFWSEDEVADFKQEVQKAGIELIAAATPLFKWYISPDDEEIEHDSFGFNPRLNDQEKQEVIKRTFDIADKLSIPRLRIFSGLGQEINAGSSFAQNPMLLFALELADQYGIDLYIENEPVCRVHDKQQIVDLLDNQNNPHLKLWLDIANLAELDEEIDKEFVSKVASRLGYVHVKDFVVQDGTKSYVPVGEGQINYSEILGTIDTACSQDLIFTVETHAKTGKVDASVKSLLATKQLVDALNKG